MPKYATKHKGREDTMRFDSFHDGWNQEKTAAFIGHNELSACSNLKYVTKKTAGSPRVTVKVRQGTVKISNSALPSAADVLAATYYVGDTKYVIATAAKLYYLDAGLDPVEIGDIDGIPTFTEFNSKLIIHDSGITKSWDGTTFDKVNKLISDELLSTGDNSTTQFTGTLSNLAVEVSSISITFVDATVKTITDDGAGNLIGDVNGGGTNTINYTTGAYDFTCSGAPDSTTLIEAEYEQAEGAPKSKAGLVRKSRLYTWGDADNTSRLTYSSVNDETATDTSSGGGYLDVDSDDGAVLTAAINFETSVLIFKEGSMHRIDAYPGDLTFSVEKITDEMGALSHRAALFEGGIVSFIADEGWVAMAPSERYGDIQKGLPLSDAFKTNASKYANSSAYSAYNPIDKQLWLSLAVSANGAHLDYIYVVSLATGAQVSVYKFAFDHSCFAFANNEMLIGGIDGNLYRLDKTGATHEDNSVSYANDCYMRTTFTDWELPLNWKHNKSLYVRASGAAGFSANLKIYVNEDYSVKKSLPLTVSGTWLAIYTYSDLLIYNVQTPIGVLNVNVAYKYKFDYRTVMIGVEDIAGAGGAEIMGVDLKTAVMGDK